MAYAQVKSGYTGGCAKQVAAGVCASDEEEAFNEQTLAAMIEARELLHSPRAKRYDSPEEAFDDVLGTSWRK